MLAVKRLPAFLCVAALILATWVRPAAPQSPGQSTTALVGKPAPPLTADFSLNGKEKTLTELRGKVVLVCFGTMWCSNCEGCLSRWKQWESLYQLRGLEVVAVTFYGGDYNVKPRLDNTGLVSKEEGALSRKDEQQMLKTFANHHKIDFRVMALPKSEMERVRQSYHLTKVPVMVLLDRQGVVRHVEEGASSDSLEKMERMIEQTIKEK